MAILRSKEIWDMEVDEIQEKLVELRTELSKNVSKSAAAGVNENPGKIRELKRTCVCEEIAREVQTVKVFTVRRRFGKLMTIIEGIDEHDIDIKELTKTLKAKCACGGTAKNSQIELQGDHKVKVKEVLSEMGFSSDTIEIRESKKNNKKRR